MTATEAPTVLAAGVTAQRCIRRPGSTWTRCRCDTCRDHTAHLAKLNRNGRYNSTALASAQDRAFAQLERWIELGWESLAVSSATGIGQSTCWELLREVRSGHRRNLQHDTVRRILAAGPPTAGRVSAAGTRRRLQALTWMGWGVATLNRELGIPVITLSDARSDTGPGTILVTIARRVADAYPRLSTITVDSPQARAVAQRRRWAPPAAWDDDALDDPAVGPQGVVGPHGRGQGRPPATDDVVLQRVRDLVRAGLNDAEVGRDIGRSPDAVAKLRSRYGIRRAA